MPGSLFHRLLPAFFGGSRVFLAALEDLDRQLRFCLRPDAAAAAADAAAPRLRAILRARFPSPVAGALALKTLNICLARYHLHTRGAALLSRPVGLVVDPSNACGLACPGCVHSASPSTPPRFDWPPATLAPDRFTALLKLYGPYAVGIYFCNYGEPLLNPHTPAFIRLAKSCLLWTGLSTSLSVPRFDAEAYAASGLDEMVLSIDGATQPVYARFRRRGSLDLVLDNLRRLVAARRRLGSRTPHLAWHFLAFEHNLHEIPRAERTARAIGVDRFSVVVPFDVAWDDPAIRPAPVRPSTRRFHWNFCRSFPETSDPELFAPALAATWSARATADDPHPPGHTCHWLYKNLVMDAAGRILPCCAAPRPDADLAFTTLDAGGDHYNSDKHRAARRVFTGPASNAPPYCARCTWDHAAVNIGAPEIRRYFHSAGPPFGRRAISLLSQW